MKILGAGSYHHSRIHYIVRNEHFIREAFYHYVDPIHQHSPLIQVRGISDQGTQAITCLYSDFLKITEIIFHSSSCCLDHQTNLSIRVSLLAPLAQVSLQITLCMRSAQRRERSLPPEELAYSSTSPKLQPKVIQQQHYPQSMFGFLE